MPRYWLMKSEPDVYSIDQLKTDRTTWWEGVRNYQARNFMTKEMQLGDQVLFYHSNANPPGIAGIAEVSELAAPDTTAMDPKSEYFEPKATASNPIWQCVQVKFVKKFKSFLPLDEIKTIKGVEKMVLLQKGSRLSVQPVSEKEFNIILRHLKD